MKKTNGYLKFKTALFFILAVLLSQIIIGVKTIPASHLDQSPNPKFSYLDSSATKRFMPFVAIPDTFGDTPAIWVHPGTPAHHEVAFFRNTFELASTLNAASLQIFADTRYEIWIDGNWVGRGPARFSRTLHEYDVYTLESLTTGSHLIAVLVQWSPNVRRSESNTPLLQLRLLGVGNDGMQNILQTGTHWKAMLSSAWEQNPALVHKNKLIGATELVDFRNLLENWMYPDYADSNWQNAVLTDPTVRTYQTSPINTIQPNTLSTQNPLAQRASLIPIPYEVSSIKYAPRSIPTLQNTPIFPQVLEVGYLSPGSTFIEPPTAAYSLSFSSPITTTIQIDMLAPSGTSTITNSVHLNGQPLTWRKAGAVRPDVMLANPLVPAGMYTLTLINTPEFPIFALPDTLNTEFPPYEQTNHAGYKNLLSEPTPNANAVTLGESGELTFEQTPSYAILELDRVTHGRFSANVSGPAGTVLTIGWDERLYQDARPLPYPGSLHPEWNQTDSWLLDGTSQPITTIDTRTGRYILLTVWGEGPVIVDNIVVYEEQYPVIQGGTFDSSNDKLDQIWQVGVDTTKINMTDAYADPWRERGQWWGDASIIDRSNRVAFGD
ncbi:MAG: hypothetical protein PVG32_19325, partial [Anaerolineales bacterium]